MPTGRDRRGEPPDLWARAGVIMCLSTGDEVPGWLPQRRRLPHGPGVRRQQPLLHDVCPGKLCRQLHLRPQQFLHPCLLPDRRRLRGSLRERRLLREHWRMPSSRFLCCLVVVFLFFVVVCFVAFWLFC